MSKEFNELQFESKNQNPLFMIFTKEGKLNATLFCGNKITSSLEIVYFY
jgi:hypothetical protein